MTVGWRLFFAWFALAALGKETAILRRWLLLDGTGWACSVRPPNKLFALCLSVALAAWQRW